MKVLKLNVYRCYLLALPPWPELFAINQVTYMFDFSEINKKSEV